MNSRNVNKVVYRLKRWSVEGREVLWTASGSWLGCQGHDDEILQPRSTEGAGGWGMGQGGMSWLGHVGGELLAGHADLGI